MKKSVIALSTLFLTIAGFSLASENQSQTSGEPFLYSQFLNAEPQQSSMPADCYCSESRKKSCKSEGKSCCANWTPKDGCNIYCGSACIAPW